jgi:outer membrane protein insertion porin family
MKKRFPFFFLIFLSLSFLDGQESPDSLLLESFKNQKKYRLGGFRIEGAEATDKNVIRFISGLTEGQTITVPGDHITDALKAVWKQGLYDNVEIYQEKIIGNDIFLVLRVTEKPRLSKFTFKGSVRKGEADDIRNKLRLLKERVLTDYLIGHVKNVTREFFVDKGYYHTQVDIKLEDDPQAKTPHKIMTIYVNKGKKVRIKDVFIHGNTVFSDRKLRRKLKESKRYRWYNIFNSGKYLEDNLKNDLPNIITKYNDKGYRDARIVKDTVYFVSKNRVNIEISLEEGHKYYFGTFRWFGNSKYRSGQLDTILNIKPGEVFNQSKLDQKLYMNPNGMDISSLYMDDGYLFFNIQPVESRINNDTIDFDIFIYEGKQAKINRVSVKGNEKTSDRVIYREIRSRPGQLFRRSDIIRTQRELAQLNYFDPEKMNVVPKPNPAEGSVDIEYTLEEKPNDQLELSGGWGGSRRSFNSASGGLGLIGTLGVSFNNFSTRNFFKKDAWRPLPTGDGQRLSIRAQTNGIFYQSYNFSFTEPWLGGRKPNSLTFSLFHTLFSNGERKYLNKKENIKNPNRSSMSIIGGSLNFGRRLLWPDNYFSMFNAINYNYYELIRYGSIFIFNNGFAHDINTNLTISRNSVDQPIFPKTGSNFTFFAQLTPPYSLFNKKNYKDLPQNEKYKFIEYHKYKITAEWFVQLTNKKAAEGKEARNLVLRTKVGYGFLAYYNKNVGFSPFERFYMGGSGLSGFQNFVAREIIALRGYPDNEVSSPSGDPIVCRYTMELRYPLTLNPQATIFMLGFAEAGNSFPSYKYFNPFKIRRSVGVGLRIFLPMFGLLGLDYGWGFDPLPGQSLKDIRKGQFHFTIGGMLGEL